ncbi:MAG: hypothetical protein AB2693_16245 [Candidatus Thiodiazotropha sp.]
MQSVNVASTGAAVFKPIVKNVFFFTESDVLKSKVDDMTKTDDKQRVDVPSNLCEQIALINDAIKYYEHVVSFDIGMGTTPKSVLDQIHRVNSNGAIWIDRDYDFIPKNGYKLLQPSLFMYYYETSDQPDPGLESTEFVVLVNYSIGTVKVEEMWVRQFQAHAEKFKPQQLQWAYRNGNREQFLVNMGMVSESTDVRPDGDIL